MKFVWERDIAFRWRGRGRGKGVASCVGSRRSGGVRVAVMWTLLVIGCLSHHFLPFDAVCILASAFIVK